MKVLSLFDGMSVAQQAFKNLGIPVEYYASEIDEYAIAVTQSQHPETTQLGDVSKLYKIDESTFIPTYITYGKFDLLIGGSPCQDLSIAKKNREGLKGQRSGLFYEYVRIRDEVKPKYFILENVNSMPKEAKEQISEILGVQPVMINASLVSAQNRKRLFWVGKWNGDKYEQVEIPQPEDKGILLRDILENDVGQEFFISKEKKVNIKNYNGESGLSPSNFNGKGYIGSEKSVALTLPSGNNSTLIYQWRRSYWREMADKDKCPTLTSAMGTGGGNVPILDKIRKLTPTECLRLQSMPDDYFDKATYKGKPISNSQRYKMCGNAFNCKVIEHIIKHL